MSQIDVDAMWELDEIAVTITGEEDTKRGDIITCLLEPTRHKRSKPNLATFTDGYVLNSVLNLTLEQAESLAQKLLDAAQEIRRMDYEL